MFDRLFHVPCRISVPIQRSEGCPRAWLAHSSLTPHRWHTFNTTIQHKVLILTSKVKWFWKFSFICSWKCANPRVVRASDNASSRTVSLYRYRDRSLFGIWTCLQEPHQCVVHGCLFNWCVLILYEMRGLCYCKMQVAADGWLNVNKCQILRVSGDIFTYLIVYLTLSRPRLRGLSIKSQ